MSETKEARIIELNPAANSGRLQASDGSTQFFNCDHVRGPMPYHELEIGTEVEFTPEIVHCPHPRPLEVRAKFTSQA
jgi:hypothetical protein